jgi:isoaspartyl peptidase/L-asparaginase-like protein (Ntn-hydrolase superfamily)
MTRCLERTIATSTGDMTNESPSQVNDSLLIGSGTCDADETRAILCLGKRDQFIRHHAGRAGCSIFAVFFT